MSRKPATFSMPIQAGATWEDEFVYRDKDNVAIDLTDYKARMQVRTRAGRYGLTTTTTLLLELTTDNFFLNIDTPSGETVPCRLNIEVGPAVHVVLNPRNLQKTVVYYSVELYNDNVSPEYVIPLVGGSIPVKGTVIRS